MTLLFSLIAITSIWCLGIKILCHEGMVFEKLGKWGEKKIEEKVLYVEPLFMCQWCMPSIHSSISFLFALVVGIIPEWNWTLLFYYPFVAMGSSLMNGLIWQYFENKKDDKELINYSIEATQIFSEWLEEDLRITEKEESHQNFINHN